MSLELGLILGTAWVVGGGIAWALLHAAGSLAMLADELNRGRLDRARDRLERDGVRLDQAPRR